MERKVSEQDKLWGNFKSEFMNHKINIIYDEEGFFGELESC